MFCKRCDDTIENLRLVICNEYVEANMHAAFVKNIPNLQGRRICNFLRALDKLEETWQED